MNLPTVKVFASIMLGFFPFFAPAVNKELVKTYTSFIENQPSPIMGSEELKKLRFEMDLSFKQGKLSEKQIKFLKSVGFELDSITINDFTASLSQVENIIHFVWVGGPIREIARDYIMVWKNLTGGNNKMKLWMNESDLMAYEFGKILVSESEKIVFNKYGTDLSPEFFEKERYEVALNYKKMFFIETKSLPLDKITEARLNFLVQNFKLDRKKLDLKLKEVKDSYNKTLSFLQSKGIDIVDFSKNLKDYGLLDQYTMETRLRHNFAAASDIIRVLAISQDGGIYLDVDMLPPLNFGMFEAEIKSKLGKMIKSDIVFTFLMESLFNTFSGEMPSRKISHFYRDSVIETFEEDGENLVKVVEQFILNKKHLGFKSFFLEFKQPLSSNYSFSIANDYGIINQVVASHKNSIAVRFLIEQIKENYRELNEFWSKFSFDVDKVKDSDIADLLKKFSSNVSEESFAKAIVSYFQDGLIFRARATIDITGPGAYIRTNNTILSNILGRHFDVDSDLDIYDTFMENISLHSSSKDKNSRSYFLHTEEEKKSSWTVNDSPVDILRRAVGDFYTNKNQ